MTNISELTKIAEQEVNKLVELAGIDANVKCDVELGENDERIVNVSFEGEDLGYLIGNGGQHMKSMQYALSMIINKKARSQNENENIERIHVLVDVGGYRQKRVERIEELALRKADDARILGEPIDLSPMAAFERRIVHMTLEPFKDIKTESYGEGEDRYVRIVPLTEGELNLEGGVQKDEADKVKEEEEETEE